MNKSYPVRTESRLLARLPPSEFRRLLPRLQPVPLNCKQVLYKALSSIEYAYFPNSGLIAALTYMENGSTIESAIIGNDGVIGLPLFLGATISSNWVIVQLAGDALRIGAEALQEEASRNGPFRELLLRYQEAFLAQVLQDVACNGLHTVKQRCCRWLLTAVDRTGSDSLSVTHELLAILLGVRRASISVVIESLQRTGVIGAGRGSLTVLDRRGLKAAACECYQTIDDQWKRLLG